MRKLARRISVIAGAAFLAARSHPDPRQFPEGQSPLPLRNQLTSAEHVINMTENGSTVATTTVETPTLIKIAYTGP